VRWSCPFATRKGCRLFDGRCEPESDECLLHGVGDDDESPADMRAREKAAAGAWTCDAPAFDVRPEIAPSRPRRKRAAQRHA
jgi:hypothetical protein